jgi:hypothetical protein
MIGEKSTANSVVHVLGSFMEPAEIDILSSCSEELAES